MAPKVLKQTRSKGERLGWTSLEKVESVALSAIVVKGCRVAAERHRDNGLVQHSLTGTFIIP